MPSTKLAAAAFAFVLMAVMLAGCGGSPGNASVEVACSAFQDAAPSHAERSAVIGVGDQLTVTLCANPTTGFEWQDPTPDPSGVVSQSSRESKAPPSGAVGTAGTDVWVFDGKASGSTTLDFSYDRPWEGGEKGVWTATVKVTVKK